MRVALWPEYARGACRVVAGLGVALAVAGCSSGVSRFDYTSFSLSDDETSGADMSTTASLPVPSESVYGSSSNYQNYGGRSRMPAPRATASYRPGQARYYGALRSGKPPGATPVTTASSPRVTVQSGDTLSSLSRRYGVSIDAIQNANNLADARLRQGQVLVIPGGKGAANPAPAVGPRVATATSELRPGERVYTVQPGDTPTSIAQKVGSDERAIMVRNDGRGDSLQIGQKLVIPAASSAPAVAQAPAASAGVRKVKTTTIPAPGDETTQNTTKAPAAAPKTPSQVASTSQLPNPDPMSGNSFRWPVKGRVISGFGTKPDGGHNDGINISVPQGTPVKAVENGVVAYAGNELKGYGNLVLVRHANNWVSAYANNEELLVSRGEKVSRGQVISKAGTTGSATQPQVHFELRKGSRPVDPTKYMSSMTAQAD
jgi:murein DD-endopeptidase MepM/ murein hydrolase activator NlpD